ncbi:hypothetical protein [Secundilactobacillus silagei]|uniref:hypothetical protein n=1 Tax=Secundilactobacillus silagei TaxID=1293415 RepID=UPI000AC23D0C|nr:hypothetical protein [Secundilactobacillus silagei]
MIKKNKFKCRICGFEYYRRCVDMINKRIGKNCEHHKYNLIYVNSEQVQRALDTYQDGKYELIDEYDPEAGRKHKYKVLCRDCGFIYRSPLDTFLSKPLVGVNCEHKNRNNNTQELQSRIDKTQEKQYELIGPYKGSMVNHIFRCRKCGFEYFTISGPFLSHRIGENCKHKKAKYSQEEVQQLLDIKQEKQFEILTKYEGLRKKVWIRCRNCNLKYETTLAPYLRLRIGVNCQHHIKLTKARAIQRVTKISNGR